MNETKPIITAERKLMFTVAGQEFTDLKTAKRHGIGRLLAGGDNPVTPDIQTCTETIVAHADEVIAILRTKERIRPPGPQPGKPRKPRKAKAAPAQSNPTA